MPQDAAWLMALVIGLYLYDSMLLLRRDEGVLMPGRRGAWSVGLGSQSYQLLGKYVFIPNPFLPHRPAFRMSWSFQGESSAARDAWAQCLGKLSPMKPMVWCMAAALFVLLPLGFFTSLGDRMLLSAIALLYLGIAAALAWTWFNRTALGVSGRRFAGLAFECVVCPPFAINIIRTISLRMTVEEDLVTASRRLLTIEQWNPSRARFVGRLDEEIELEDEGSERMERLLSYRLKLIEP